MSVAVGRHAVRSIVTGKTGRAIAEAQFRPKGARLYIREEEIQHPDPDCVVLFHDLVSILLIARNNIQKEAVLGTLGVQVVPPALSFRPPAYLTAHGSYFLICSSG